MGGTEHPSHERLLARKSATILAQLTQHVGVRDGTRVLPLGEILTSVSERARHGLVVMRADQQYVEVKQLWDAFTLAMVELPLVRVMKELVHRLLQRLSYIPAFALND